MAVNNDPKYIEYYSELLNERDDGHTVMVEIPKFKSLMDYITAIPDNVVYRLDDPEFGRTRNPHVTVLFGVNEMEKEKTKALLRRVPSKITATLQAISKFENPEFDVLKIDVSSPYLSRVNKFLRSNVEYENDHPTYHPHLTLCYLKKGTGDKYVGDTRFAGMRVAFKTFLYSDEYRRKEVVPMKGSGDVNEAMLGLGGGYGGSPGGQIAASGWAATYSSPQSSGRLGTYKKTNGEYFKQTTRDMGTGNTVSGINPYDSVNDNDLVHPTFSADEIRTGIRYEMLKMEFPDKDIGKQITLQNLKKNPRFYSDLHQYFGTEK